MNNEEPIKISQIEEGKSIDLKGRHIFAKGNKCAANNNKGRGISITSAIKRKLLSCPKGKRKTYLEILVTKILNKACLRGDTIMIKAIWNYIDGLPKQPIVGGGDENPVIIKVIKEMNENGAGDTNVSETI